LASRAALQRQRVLFMHARFSSYAPTAASLHVSHTKSKAIKKFAFAKSAANRCKEDTNG
jgi:hypothetical protein